MKETASEPEPTIELVRKPEPEPEPTRKIVRKPEPVDTVVMPLEPAKPAAKPPEPAKPATTPPEPPKEAVKPAAPVPAVQATGAPAVVRKKSGLLKILVAVVVIALLAVAGYALWQKLRPGLFQGSPDLKDDFSNPSGGWQTSDAKESSARYENGTLVLSAARGKWASSLNPGLSYEDFALQVEVTQAGDVSEFNSGVFARYKDQNNYYAFAISGDGKCTITKMLNGRRSSLIDWEQAGSIRTGSGATNVLGILCQGPAIVLYVNGQSAAFSTDSDFPSGGIGFFVSNFESDKKDVAQVSFGNLKIWKK